MREQDEPAEDTDERGRDDRVRERPADQPVDVVEAVLEDPEADPERQRTTMQTKRKPSVFDWVAMISPVTAMPPPARNHFSCWRSSPLERRKCTIWYATIEAKQAA